jgi:hypothetical protein
MLVALLFVQLVLGVLVRHLPTPLAQRLHFLMAFVLTVGGMGDALANDAALIEPTSLVWERFLDGSSQDVASGAAIPPSGDIAVVGTTSSGPGRDGCHRMVLRQC